VYPRCIFRTRCNTQPKGVGAASAGGVQAALLPHLSTRLRQGAFPVVALPGNAIRPRPTGGCEGLTSGREAAERLSQLGPTPLRFEGDGADECRQAQGQEGEAPRHRLFRADLGPSPDLTERTGSQPQTRNLRYPSRHTVARLGVVVFVIISETMLSRPS
jgi:hypothetical protein